jgi:hypothetical protein
MDSRHWSSYSLRCGFRLRPYGHVLLRLNIYSHRHKYYDIFYKVRRSLRSLHVSHISSLGGMRHRNGKGLPPRNGSLPQESQRALGQGKVHHAFDWLCVMVLANVDGCLRGVYRCVAVMEQSDGSSGSRWPI